MGTEVRPPRRYLVEGVFARGGVGAIHGAQDRALHREVAYKVLLPERAIDATYRVRFVREARLSAQLQHPNILPIYDLGRDEDGNLFFAMKRVHGRSLDSILRGLRREEADLLPRFPLPRLLGMFSQVCQAVHYAHTRGVLHRDLKPANVMIGALGEVLLMDWGLAKRITPLPTAGRQFFGTETLEPLPPPPQTTDESVVLGPEGEDYPEASEDLPDYEIGRTEVMAPVEGTPERNDRLVDSWSVLGPSQDDPLGEAGNDAGVFQTAVGRVLGTPAYMAPEQARGRDLSYATDVYGLGTILYEILSLRPAFGGRDVRRVMVAVSRGAFRSPTEVALPERPPVDPALEAICLRAMALEPADRYATAWDLFLALEDFLQGHEEERRREAAALGALEDAQRYEGMWNELDQSYRNASDQAQQLVGALSPWDSTAQKRAAWAAEDACEALAVRREQAMTTMEQRLREALSHNPKQGDARRMLGRHLWQRLLAAERASQDREVARLEQELRAVADTTWAPLLDATSSVRVGTVPSSATARIAPLFEQDRRLLPGAFSPVDERERPLPPGRYLVECEAEGREPLVQCVRLERGERLSLHLRLPTTGALPEGFAFIPGGRAALGGGAGEGRALRPCTVELPDFAMQRFPVTMREYLEFLATLSPEEAWTRAPRNESTSGQLLARSPDGRLSLPEEDSEGHQWTPDLPVMAISFLDAVAYAAWRGAKDGVRYRLPTDAEWEYAARTPDGRHFSWGDRWVPGYALTLGAERTVQPRPIGSYASDQNPYGLRDLVGGSRDWCDGWKSAAREMRLLRGGAWWDSHEKASLLARTGWPAHGVYGDTGIRLVCSMPPEADGPPLLSSPDDPRYGGLQDIHLPPI